MEIIRRRLMPGVHLTYIQERKFKTNLLSAQLVSPLRRETASANALLPAVLRRGTARYPDMECFSRVLDELYGASRRIARGDYSARAEVATQDEIGSVAESFNAMAAAVQKNVDALALSARQREEFMGAFTHELKTPMTAIIGYADTLRGQAEAEENEAFE